MIQIKAILPKKFNSAVFEKELSVEAEKISKDQQKDFELTTKTWSKPVKFERTVSSEPTRIVIFVGTDNKIYAYISKGTKRHYVAPVRAKALRFPKVYKAKSMPGVLASGGGGSSGGFAFSKGHFVSGIKARKYDKLMKKIWEKKVQTRMQAALSRAAKKSNHAI